MKIRLARRTAGIVAACALATTPVALAGLLPAQAADGSFTALTTLPTGTYGDLVSPADGQAYVAGLDTTGKVWARHWADGRLQDVVVPDSGITKPRLDLAVWYGRTYLLQWDPAGKVQGTIHDIGGAKAAQLELPDTVPGRTLPFAAEAIAADDTGFFVVVREIPPTGTSRGEQFALRFDGRDWFASPSAPGTQALHWVNQPSAEVKGGVLYRFASSYTEYGQDQNGYRWDGRTQVSVPRRSWTYMDGGDSHPGWTFTSPTDYTMWGHTTRGVMMPGQPSYKGLCTHVVGTQQSPCPAPVWSVNAAARVADGRILLGREDRQDDASGQASYALVDHDGAQPVDFPGDNDDRVAGLSAAPTGRTVMAVTQAGASWAPTTTMTLRSATLPPIPPPPTTPTPTWTPPTSTPPGPPQPHEDPSSAFPPPTKLPRQVVVNGEFEEGRRGWVGSTGPITDNPGRPAVSGAWKMWLGGNGTTATEYEQQTVTVPHDGVLYFWISIDTAERSRTIAYDTATVSVDGTTVASFSNRDATTGYVNKWVDLSRWAGKTVTLRFSAKEDSEAQTSFVFDGLTMFDL